MAIKKSKKSGVLVGTIKEFNLKKEENVAKLKAYSAKQGKMVELPACARYVAGDWNKTHGVVMTVTVNNIDITVYLSFDVKELCFDNKSDETKTDYAFSGLEALTSKYVMGETRVKVKVNYENGERVRKNDDGEFYWNEGEPIKLTYASITSSNVPDTDYTQFDITSRILDIRDITKDGEATGDVAVKLGMIAGTNSELFPFATNVIMDKVYKYVENGTECEITAEEFKQYFSVGDNVSVSTTLVGIVPKVIKSEKRDFGKGAIQSGGGKPTLEYHIVGASKLIPTDEYTISEADWNKLIEEKKNITAIRVQNSITKAQENAQKQTSGSAVKGSSATAMGQKPFGASPFDDVPTSDDEIPFI